MTGSSMTGLESIIWSGKGMPYWAKINNLDGSRRKGHEWESCDIVSSSTLVALQLKQKNEGKQTKAHTKFLLNVPKTLILAKIMETSVKLWLLEKFIEITSSICYKVGRCLCQRHCVRSISTLLELSKNVFRHKITMKFFCSNDWTSDVMPRVVVKFWTFGKVLQQSKYGCIWTTLYWWLCSY